MGLPPELLEKSRKRVGVMAILALIGFGMDVVLPLAARLVELLGGPAASPGDQGQGLVGSLVAVGTSVTLLLVIRNPRVAHTTVLKLGLGFEVVLCAIISVVNPWSTYEASGHLPGLTWASPLIIMFPLIIPTKPSRTVAVALAAAATAPLGLLYLEQTGRVAATGEDYVASIFSVCIAALFAFVASRVVYGLGVDLSRARQVGSYVLEERLGAGGMGEVWKAKHNLLARPAAIKMIRSEADPGRSHEVLERFKQEAQATALMHSPHTIELYDFGVTPDGLFYYVMELLDGMDLQQLVQRFGPVSPDRAVHILRQVCDSLGEAHESGLIHRDVKPANIYVCRYGRRFDFVKVLDFGLVKSSGVSELPDPQLTGADVAAGTPATMSPEQIRGESLDGRSDLYGVGCLGYWLLTGRMVFEGKTPLEVLSHHLHTAPAPPSRFSEEPVPPALEKALLACLEKSPDERPASAEALDGILAGIAAEHPWTPDQARGWWGGHMGTG